MDNEHAFIKFPVNCLQSKVHSPSVIEPYCARTPQGKKHAIVTALPVRN